MDVNVTFVKSCNRRIYSQHKTISLCNAPTPYICRASMVLTASMFTVERVGADMDPSSVFENGSSVVGVLTCLVSDKVMLFILPSTVLSKELDKACQSIACPLFRIIVKAYGCRISILTSFPRPLSPEFSDVFPWQRRQLWLVSVWRLEVYSPVGQLQWSCCEAVLK